jgi:S-adenosylhomocysteine hydrolase
MLELLAFTDHIWGNLSLKRTAIIGAQHIMDSTLELFRHLKRQGLDPSKTFLMGKCYSTSPEVFRDFLREGFYVHKNSFHFDSHENYDDVYKDLLFKFARFSLGKIDFKEIDRLIVIDDGGYLISELNTLNVNGVPVVSIEQTSSGFNYLKNIKLNTSVINVARSKAKLELETPYIVESSLKRLQVYLSAKELTGKNVLVLGQGVIGTCVGNTLRRFCNVVGFDPVRPSDRSLEDHLSQADIVLGCSGTKSLDYSLYDSLKPGAKLISLASSDREFNAYRFRRQFPVSNRCLDTFSDGNISLIQGGFPINFFGERNNMSMEKIQITLTLLLSSVYQALTTTSDLKGIVSIDEEAERLIISKFKSMISKDVGSLPLIAI